MLNDSGNNQEFKVRISKKEIIFKADLKRSEVISRGQGTLVGVTFCQKRPKDFSNVMEVFTKARCI